MKFQYCVDMVRLKVRIEEKSFKLFYDKRLNYNTHVEYWESFAMKQYRHNWSIQNVNAFGREAPFYLAFRHNMEKPKGKFNLVIEYNPSKVHMCDMLQEILTRFFYGDSVEVVSVDVAVDMPYPIDDINIDKNNKSHYQYYQVAQGDYTHYIGKGDGRVKIYNKAKELGIEGDLTRYEVTLKIGEPCGTISDYEIKCSMAQIFLRGCESPDATLNALIYAVDNGYPFESISRKYKARMREMYKEQSPVTISPHKVKETIVEFINGLQLELAYYIGLA